MTCAEEIDALFARLAQSVKDTIGTGIETRPPMQETIKEIARTLARRIDALENR